MNIQKPIEKKVTDTAYHDIKDALNASGIRMFYSNRHKFYKQYILGESVTDKRTVSTLLGDLVHTIIADNGEFDDKYCMSSVGTPTGQILQLTDKLYELALKARDSEGRITQSFENLFMEAVNQVKYDRDMQVVAFKGKEIDKILGMFTTPDKNGASGEAYYRELLSNTGKTTVSISQINQAEKIVEKLRTHSFSCNIVNLQTEVGVRDVFNEMVIMFQLPGIGKCKAKLDKVIVDHLKREILPYDYKTGWSIDDGGFEYSYLKNMYYIPAAFYDMALEAWKLQEGLKGYKINEMTYIACDTTNGEDPLIYPLTAQDMEYAYQGFSTDRGVSYKGINTLLSEIRNHMETGIWSHSLDAHKTNGVMRLNIKYS